MKKKVYNSPVATFIEVATTELIAASVGFSNDRTSSSEDDQLAGSNRGQWGNLWNK